MLHAAYCRAVPDTPARVLWLAKGLGPGGAERLLVEVARTIDHRRFDCQAAYLLPAKNHLVGDLAAAGVPAVCLHGAGRQLDWTLRLRRLVATERIDLVHVHAPYPAVLARFVVRSLGRRRPALVYTEHNVWDGYGVTTRWANALTYPLDDARLAVSADAVSSAPRPFRRRSEVLVHGVDLAEVRSHLVARSQSRKNLGVADGEVLAVTVANLRAHKDYPTLLAAARLVLDSGAPVRFAAVGQGPLESEVRGRLEASGLGDRFQLLGYRADALDVMAAADLFVLSSLAEGLPVAVMEALALGLPIAATSVGGLPGAVRDGVEGLLVPPARPDLLAEAIGALARDPERRGAMASAAAARADAYDIRRATRRIEAVYCEALAGLSGQRYRGRGALRRSGRR
jgi:glycosyltransferase involved in cell wall biosynthesis